MHTIVIAELLIALRIGSFSVTCCSGVETVPAPIPSSPAAIPVIAPQKAEKNAAIPFGGIGFLGCTGKEICEPIEPEPDPGPECKTATVDLNLDIHVPEATYQSLIGTSNIWFDLEFKGVDPDKDFIWRLKDFGENK